MLIKLFIPFLFFLVNFIVGIWVLPDYGQNWDEPTHFYRGETYLNLFLAGKKDAKNLPSFKPYFQKDDTVFFAPVGVNKSDVPTTSLMQSGGGISTVAFWDRRGHPPLSDVFSAFFNYVLFQKLGLINDIDSFHLYSVFLSSILIAFIFWWVRKEYNYFAAIVASLSLALYPLFLGESHFNIKDPPEAVFYSFTIITFYEALVRKSNRWLILSSVLWGFAFATKFNAVFIPFTLVPWLFIYLFNKKTSIKKYVKLIPSFLLYPVIPFLILFASWPFLWKSPIKNFLLVVKYYTNIGNDSSFDPRFITYFGLNTYALKWIFYSTPIVILFFFFCGLLYVILYGFKENKKTTLLVFLWFLIPIARVTRPDAGIYGGVRQIMEFIPAMAILAGIGASLLRTEFLKRIRLFKVKNAAVILSILFIAGFIPVLIKMVKIHPNEGVYFNPIIGGLAGAKNAELPGWGESLGNPYKQGIRWVNRHVEPNAKLTIDFGLMPNIPQIFIRSDIRYSTRYRSGPFKEGEYVIGLTHNSGLENEPLIYYLNNLLIPLYEVEVDGVSLLKVWKNDLVHTKEEYRSNKEVAGIDKPIVNDNTFEIDIHRIVSLYGIEITYNDNDCRLPDENGYFSLSENGSSWARLSGDFTAIPGMGGVINPLSDKKLFYWFSGKPARYIGADFGTDNSCLKNITSVKVLEMTK